MGVVVFFSCGGIGCCFGLAARSSRRPQRLNHQGGCRLSALSFSSRLHGGGENGTARTSSRRRRLWLASFGGRSTASTSCGCGGWHSSSMDDDLVGIGIRSSSRCKSSGNGEKEWVHHEQMKYSTSC